MGKQDYSGRTVLFADDEPQLVDVFARTIRQQIGCKVVACPDGDKALRALSERSFDVFVTDMLMPGCHGIPLIARAKELRPECDVMVITGHADEFPYLEAFEAGASDFVSKPYPPEELCARLLRVLKDRDRRDIPVARHQPVLVEAAGAESAHSPSGDRYGLMFERNMNGMLVLDPHYVIQDVNSAFCDVCGRSRDEILGTPVLDWLADRDRERFTVGIGAIVANGRGALADIRALHNSGRELWLDVSVTCIQDRGEDTIVLVCSDVTERRQIEDQLVEIASKDELTGLFNQRIFYSRLSGAMDWSDLHEMPVTLVFMDLDNFKQCNDQYGHQVGDALLRSVGEIIRRSIRAHDDGFRYGGDEFALILRGADVDTGAKAAERIQRSFAGQECYGASISFGVAMYKPNMDAEAFVKVADEALYQAKSAGKNAIYVA